jgi:hypothetical protein
VSISEVTDPQAIESAMLEFDRVGREAFLAQYGFGPARQYFVRAARHGRVIPHQVIIGATYLPVQRS